MNRVPVRGQVSSDSYISPTGTAFTRLWRDCLEFETRPMRPRLLLKCRSLGQSRAVCRRHLSMTFTPEPDPNAGSESTRIEPTPGFGLAGGSLSAAQTSSDSHVSPTRTASSSAWKAPEEVRNPSNKAQMPSQVLFRWRLPRDSWFLSQIRVFVLWRWERVMAT